MAHAERPRSRTNAALAGLLALAALAPLASGCAAPEAKAPNPTRPLDERRALEVIRRAIQSSGEQPGPARDEKLQGGWDIHVDVGVNGRAYGVVYVTEEDAAKLGAAIPPANKQSESLRLVRGGPDGETRLVLLYQQNYLYDDLAGASHEQTTIACERRLARDAADFVTHAKAQGYK